MYTNLKTKLDILNSDKTHFINSNDICTPMDCVEEMLNSVPNEFWNRKGISILDPCAGNGNFPAYIEELLRINNNKHYSLTINEINEKRILNIKRFFNNYILKTEDFFLFDENVKYDLIVANPPYAKINITGFRAAKNHGLSKEFIIKSLKLLNHNGYLVFIVPDNWMSLSDRNHTVELLSKYQFIKLNIHGAKKYFPGVGSSFTWFVLNKVKNNQPFIIENSYIRNENSVVSIDVGSRNIPLFFNSITKSIIDKTLNCDNEKIKVETTSDLHKYTKKHLLSTQKDDIFKYKIIHTQNQTVWGSRPHKYQDGIKVFISLTSYYSTFIDYCGMTQSIAFVRCSGIKEAETIKKILDHPLYIFLNNIHRYGNFNNIRILQKFPMPSDHSDIWESFNITNKEKSFILSMI